MNIYVVNKSKSTPNINMTDHENDGWAKEESRMPESGQFDNASQNTLYPFVPFGRTCTVYQF